MKHEQHLKKMDGVFLIPHLLHGMPFVSSSVSRLTFISIVTVSLMASERTFLNVGKGITKHH
jgi:hypothetical protein